MYLSLKKGRLNKITNSDSLGVNFFHISNFIKTCYINCFFFSWKIMSQYWIERGVLGPLSSRCMSWNLAFPLLLNKSKINYLFVLNKPDYCFCIYSDAFHITTWLNSTFKITIFKNLKSKLGNKYIRLMLLNLFKFRSQLSKKRSLRGGEGELSQSNCD